MTTSLLRPFKIRHKKVCCSYINLQQPPNRPLWVLYLSASLSPLFSPLGCHISTPLQLTHPHHHHHPHSASLRASVEIRSSLSEVLCHVAQGAWNSPRAVEQTQAQGLSIAAPQTNCLSNEPPSLSRPHTHTRAHTSIHTCAHCDSTLSHTHTHTHGRTHARTPTHRSRFDLKGSDTLLEEKTHEWHFSVCRLVSAIVTGRV